MSVTKGRTGDVVGVSTAQVSRRDAARRVRQAVEQFIAAGDHAGLHGHAIDDAAKAVLRRLWELGPNSYTLTAAEAIVEVVPEERWGFILADCVLAEHRARNHGMFINNARYEHDQAVEAEGLLDQLARNFAYVPPTVSSASVDNPMDDAFQILRAFNQCRMRLASDHLRVASRKTTEEAARAAGIGWLKDAMKSASTSAAPRHIAAIATAALDMGEVTAEAARKAPSFRERLHAIR